VDGRHGCDEARGVDAADMGPMASPRSRALLAAKSPDPSVQLVLLGKRQRHLAGSPTPCSLQRAARMVPPPCTTPSPRVTLTLGRRAASLDLDLGAADLNDSLRSISAREGGGADGRLGDAVGLVGVDRAAAGACSVGCVPAAEWVNDSPQP